MPYIGPLNFVIGTMYQPPPGFTQPGGPGTQVFPAQVSGGGPISTKPVTEQSGFFSFGCSHQVNSPMIFFDYDLETDMSAALVCCPLCTYIQRAIEPAEEFYNPIENAITIP